jgi:hypothetical protein
MTDDAPAAGDAAELRFAAAYLRAELDGMDCRAGAASGLTPATCPHCLAARWLGRVERALEALRR